MFRRLYGPATALGLVLALTSPAVQAESFILATPMAQDHIFHPVSEAFIEKLAELSDGTLEVEYHPGGDLGDWTVLFEQVMQGALPMTITFAAPDYDRRLGITQLAYAVDGWESAEKALGPEGSMLPVYQGIYDDLGMELLGVVPVDFHGIALRKGNGRVPVNFPEDARGIKMRVIPSGAAVKRYEILGFSPVPMPFSELYTALQLGTVDARAYAPPVEIWQMRDVIETYVRLNDSFEQGAWLVNRDWWEGLTDDQRAAIEGARDYALEVAWSEARKASDGYVEQVRDYGIEIVDLTPEQLSAAKTLLQDQEWTWMEQEVGQEVLSEARAAAGVN